MHDYSQEVISDLMPDHLVEKYASLSLKMFVDNYLSVKWEAETFPYLSWPRPLSHPLP